MKRFIDSFVLLTFLAVALVGFSVQANAQWTWGRAASGGTVDCWPIATDNAGNIFTAGIAVYHASSLDFGTGVTIPPYSIGGAYQTLWVKYNHAGIPQWAGGTSFGSTNIFNICTDPSGNLILFGSFTSATMTIGSFTLTNAYGTTSAAQYFLAKLDPSGTVLWAINDGNINPSYFTIQTAFILSAGGVATDAAGNIYITSSFNKRTMTIGTTTLTNADTSGSTYDIFVAKYTPAGVPVWASSIGGLRNDYGFGITVASTGYVYITGTFYSPTFSVGSGTLANPSVAPTIPYVYPYAYIAKFSSAGVPVWAQGEGGTRGAFGVGIAHDIYGNVYMTGGFADSTITFGSVTVGRTLGTAGNDALYLVQYSSADVVTWYKSISSSNRCYGYSVALTGCGQVWVSGNYLADADVDGHTLALVAGADPVFVAGYDLSTGVVGYSGLGSGGDDQNGIACDDSGNVYLASDFFGDSLFVGHDTVWATGGGSEHLYIAKYANASCTPTKTPALPYKKYINIYPNPASNTISVVTSETVGKIEIMDVYGKRVIVKSVNQPEMTVDIHTLPRGIYFAVWLDGSGGRTTQKLVVE